MDRWFATAPESEIIACFNRLGVFGEEEAF